MISQTKLTRVELHDKREQLELAGIGRDLLEDRLGALISSFMKYAKRVLRARQDLSLLSRQSAKSMAVSSSIYRDKLILSAYSTPITNGVIIRRENIMGTTISSLELVSKNSASPEDKQLPLTVESDQVAQTAELFKRQMSVLVDLARMEKILDELGREMQRVRHRYNALDNLLIPELKKEIQKIMLSLEEKEREESFKMRIFMNKRSNQ
ncbi:MAG: V-type ATP synthase subunit D [Candidatus Heimdallarchaeota archaeon]|nr:V-type ATP synthase subunit D [Candidatus Heimdallarchaeota archaeon]